MVSSYHEALDYLVNMFRIFFCILISMDEDAMVSGHREPLDYLVNIFLNFLHSN